MQTTTHTEQTQKILAPIVGQLAVECRLPQEDMQEIIAVDAQASALQCEVSSGRVNFSGRMVCTVAYIVEGGTLARKQKGVEFSHYFDRPDLQPDQTCSCQMEVLHCQIKREGTAYSIRIVLRATVDLFCLTDRTYVSQIEGAYAQTKTLPFGNLVRFSGETEVDDTFEADSVVDLLIPKGRAIVTDCYCQSGVVMVKGELLVSLLAMRGQSPVCIERLIPFSCELINDQAYINRLASCTVEVKECQVTAQVEEERGQCELSLTAGIRIEGHFWEEHPCEVVCDAYDCKQELHVAEISEQVQQIVERQVRTERVHGNCITKAKLEGDCTLKSTALPRVDYQINEELRRVEGSVSATLLYEQSGELRATTVDLPFSFALAQQGDCTLHLAVSNLIVRIKPTGECEGEGSLKVVIERWQTEELRYLSKVEEGELCAPQEGGIYVFFSERGEDLWALCKRLKKSQEEVKKENPDLKFPLNGTERIIVYRKKEA